MEGYDSDGEGEGETQMVREYHSASVSSPLPIARKRFTYLVLWAMERGQG
jgi:hypothetical protein